MSKPSNIKTLTQPAQTEEVVQEYMDNLLADMFPDIPDHPVNNVVELAQPELENQVEEEVADVLEADQSITEGQKDLAVESRVSAEPTAVAQTEAQTESTALNSVDDVDTQSLAQTKPEHLEDDIQSNGAVQEEVEKRYPQAPIWAQEEFDVLLFEVCGLKLAVSMEALGRIIKVDHEPNHLIGRPDWFLGAYNEAENHYYVVDTAKYIMPEKGFDLSESGYEYVIQMQHSKWTLACQKLHTTVRLHPESVKWRTEKGKRPWLAGTVVDQMCALVHVDSLIEILDEAAAS